jgi:hypothetical protein
MNMSVYSKTLWLREDITGEKKTQLLTILEAYRIFVKAFHFLNLT